jgi:hypothetical protein
MGKVSVPFTVEGQVSRGDERYLFGCQGHIQNRATKPNDSNEILKKFVGEGVTLTLKTR